VCLEDNTFTKSCFVPKRGIPTTFTERKVNGQELELRLIKKENDFCHFWFSGNSCSLQLLRTLDFVRYSSMDGYITIHQEIPQEY
jgi:hypothetical protein